MKRVTVAVCLAFMPYTAMAAGLGKLTVMSSLGQPLNAEIELLSTTKDELSSLAARIAPSSVYAEQSIERASSLSAIRIDVSKRSDGTPVLKLTSPQSINDPFLDMLVQLDWSAGSLLREYTALLDPPGFGDQPANPSVAEAIPQNQVVPALDEQSTVSKPSAQRKGKPRKVAAAPKESDEVKSVQQDSSGNLATKPGDTLRGLVSRIQPVEGISIDQMLVGLHRANPEAFVGNNMNRLKVGQILRQPNAEDLQNISVQDAAKEIRVQAADWNAYRNRLASAVAEAAPTKEDASRQSASGKISAPVEDKGALPGIGPRDVVKLSKGDVAPEKSGAASESKDTAKGSKSGQDKANALQEEVTAREKAIKEANDRVALLEKQVQELKQLLEMKNQTLSDLQKNVSAPKAESQSQPAPEPAASTTPPATPSPETKPEVKPDSANNEAGKPKPQPAKIVPPPVAEPDLLDTILAELLNNLPMLGGLLAALGGVGWLAGRRKRKKGADASPTAQASAPLAMAAVAADGDTSFLTDFSPPAGGGMIDTNDVDPIAEAEVYMAYGRDAQAEELLKDSIKKDSKRYELHVKLLEIYVNRKDKAAFDVLANELFNVPGTDDPIWPKVAELGRRIDPDNSRYIAQSGESESESVDMEATQVFDMAQPASEGAAPDVVPEATLDFSLDAGDKADEAPHLEAMDGNSLDFDISGLEEPHEVAELKMPSMETETPVMESLPDLGDIEGIGEVESLPELEAHEEDTEAVLEIPAAELDEAEDISGLGFSLELPEPAAEENAQLDAADLGMIDAGIEPLPELDELGDIGLPALEEPTVEDVLEDKPEEAEAKPEKKPRRSRSKKSASDEDVVTPAALDESVQSDGSGLGIEALPELEDSVAEDALDGLSLELPEMGSDEAPEEIGLEELSDMPTESMAGLDLVLPELEEPSDEKIELTEPVSEESSFELPEVEDIEAAPELVAESISIEAPATEEPEFDLEQTMIMQAPPAQEAPAMTEAVEEPALAEISMSEITDFDLETETSVPDVPVGEGKAAPDVDLSGIDLDLGGAAKQAAPELQIEDEITLTSTPESADVDTKLDLVTAYLDMGDKEGARELLQEVLDEGGPQQRERAQKMMSNLD